MRRTNIQHGQARTHVSKVDMVVVGVLIAVGISALMLMCAPSITGG